MYVLLRPEKKRKHHGSAAEALRARGRSGGDGSVPNHLRRWVLTEVPAETCPWSLSGPQFPQPTAIQQRYCYPKGDPEYAGRKGGALWTMYGRDGKEDFEFRLLHVYFSAKRAINKGVTLSEEDRLKQQLQTEAANAAVSVLAGTPKRTAKRVSRAFRSPWQERAANQAAGAKRTMSNMRTSMPPNSSHWTERSGSPFRENRLPSLLPPPSPFQTRCTTMDQREDRTIFVSPNTAASSDQNCRDGHPLDQSIFDHPPFHMVPSFDLEDPIKSATMPSKNPCPFRGAGAQLQYDLFPSSGGRALIEGSDSFAFNETDVTELGGNIADSWNDPLLSLSNKASFDNSENKKSTASQYCDDRLPLTSAEALKSRLGHVHERIRAGILAHPASEQGPLLSIVASWARAVATSPLAPTIQNNEGFQPIAIKQEPKSPFVEATAI